MKGKIEIPISLAFSPISNFDFMRISDLDTFKKVLSKSYLYIICQRSELLFQNIVFNEKEHCVEFEIEKKGRKDRLKIVMDIYQDSITTDKSQKITFKPYTYHTENWDKKYPYMNVRGCYG